MKSKKLLALALSSAVLFGSFAGGNPADASYRNAFKDITEQNVYYDVIHSMAKDKIINGYEDKTFKPNETINRKQAAALVNRAAKLKKVTEFKAPKDLSIKNAYYKDIKKLMEAGLLETDSSGNINPNAPLTRGEMAKILAVAFNLKPASSSPLTDVSKNVEKYVASLYQAGVTTGYPDKTFKENQSLTRSNYAVFMYRAMNLDESGVINEEAKGQIAYANSYIGKYGKGKVPMPNKYKGMERQSHQSIINKQYDEFVSAMPRGAFKMKIGVRSSESYTAVISQISEATGLKFEDVENYIEKAAKTGETVKFKDSNNQEYFLIFGYSTSNIAVGEIHSK